MRKKIESHVQEILTANVKSMNAKIELMKIATDVKDIKPNCSRIYDNYSHCQFHVLFSKRFSVMIQTHGYVNLYVY